MEQVLGHFQPNVLSVSKTTSDAGLRALCCVCVGVCLFIFAVRRNGTVFNQKRIKDEKLILGCLLALFASGCNDNEPEQKPVELKISFAGRIPSNLRSGAKRLAFTVTGDDLEGLTFAAEPDEALSGWTVVVSAGREGMPTRARSMLRRPQLRRKRP
ncbi:MAG: hypothetical protein ACLRM8_04355 [Alistipes sp.]